MKYDQEFQKYLLKYVGRNTINCNVEIIIEYTKFGDELIVMTNDDPFIVSTTVTRLLFWHHTKKRKKVIRISVCFIL